MAHIESFESTKDQGNSLFKQGNYKDAITKYHEALELATTDEDRLTIYRNLSATYLKCNNYEEALTYSTKALTIKEIDDKSLYRKVKAQMGLERYRDAVADAVTLQKLCPRDKLIQDTLRELNQKMQEIGKKESSLINRVNQTLDYLFDPSLDEDKQVTAANNLVVLAKEKSGARLIIDNDGVNKMHNKFQSTKSIKVKLPLVRAFSEISKHEAYFAIKVLEKFGIDDLLMLMVDQFTSEESVMALQYLVQIIINSLTGFNPKENLPVICERMQRFEKEINEIMVAITKRTSSRAMCGEGRDALLELVSRNVGPNGLNWGRNLVSSGCLYNLLEVASELEDLKYESSMPVTRNTKSLVAIALERTYECMDFDKIRDDFRHNCMEYIKDKLRGGDVESRIRAIMVITTLLQGPVDVGNFCISQQGIVEMMLLMAKAEDDELQQKVAAEAIIAAASKKEKCTSIASMGAGILKKLYQSQNESIKVRALVGLCKIGSVGGSDASLRPFSDESVQKLANACKKIIINPSKDRDIKKWASEGLAYLTLDADIKEDLITDKEALTALIDLARTGDLSLLYGIVTTFVNLTNSYDKKEIMPELIELAKFAKQHVPEEHLKDSKEFVDARVKALANMDVTSALVALSKTESISSREMIARIFNAICEHHDLRGKVVQQGGVKTLLNLFTSSNTERGKIISAQALARIGISIDPKVSFPGQRSHEVIRPLMRLLDVECSALENFEALMALTNLAQVDEHVQRAILKDGGFSKIEHYIYDDHPMLKRAATQCIANMVTNEEVIKLFEEENDRCKYFLYLCDDGDRDTIVAAAGALAMLTGASTKACEKITQAKDWDEMLMVLCSSSDLDIQHRALFLVRNIINADKGLAERIIETKLFEVLVAISRPEVDNIDEKFKAIAKEILDKCQEYEIIKPIENS